MFHLFLFVLFGTQGIPVSSQSSCPRGFELSEASCYFFSHGQESWIGAFESCRLFDAMLVEVNSQKESDYLGNRTAALGPKDAWWISLTDKLVEGEYIWETSMSLLTVDGFQNWAPGEPNNSGGNENCVKLDNSHNFQWTDTECDHTNKYICEKEASGLIVG